MPSTNITIPNFQFSAFYYPQILEALILYKRINVPELTDESEFEPFIQLLRAVACVGHLNNVLIDLVANESTLPTAQLPESVRNMLRLIGYELRSATPSQTDMVHKLAAVRTTTTELVRARSQFATRRSGTDPIVFFETSEALSIGATNLLSKVYLCDEVDGGYDETSDANDPGEAFGLWTTPIHNAVVYFGHSDVMFDKLTLTVNVAADLSGVWEYYDGDWTDESPDSVSDLGGQLLFDLSGLLGDQNRAGAVVRITLNSTGAYEETVSTWNGSTNTAQTGLIGQTAPSVVASDYTVGADWRELPDVSDGTAGLTVGGDVEFTLPQNEYRDWRKTEIDGVLGYYIRYRVISVNTVTSIELVVARIDTGGQYALTPVTQGRTVLGEILGSSTGAPDQRFEIAKDYFIWDSETVYVDDVEWTRVDNFLESLNNDKHYVVELGEDDRATFVFGDGANGSVPAIGQGNISSDYRWGANEDGNVGAGAVTVDKSGLSYVSTSWNPRQAVGWSEAQSASETSLARAKIAGPATLRTRDVALGPDDMEELAVAFTDDDGASPYVRAQAVEEGFGVKTTKLIVVVSGGGQASSSQLSTLDTHFNGDATAVPPVKKHLVANQEVTSVNYTPRSIDINATVEATSGVTAAAILNQLARILHPEALKADGVTWMWEFGDEIAHSRLEHEIFEADPRIKKVALVVPSGDTQLGGDELPTLGTATITLVEV